MPFLRTKNYTHFEIVNDTTYAIEHTFEGAANARKALPGDEVTLDGVKNVTLVARAPHPVLAGYLELNSKTTYGLTKKGMPLYLFIPLNPAYPSFMVASSSKDRSTKQVALVEFLEWSDDRILPRGALKEILGPVGDVKAEEAALLWNACPWSSLTQGLAVLEDDCPSRTIVEGTTFNIDPEGCKDIDDCVTLMKDGEGWRLTITIADVASAIEELGAVDCMAAAQGQTLYRDGMAIKPMLPPFYSENECSLVPGTVRRGVSLTLRFNEKFCTSEPVWSETLITNQTTYSYENFEKSPDAETLCRLVSTMEGRTIEDPHEWIEVLMLYYNTEAAKLLLNAGVGILRTHSEPDLARLEKYRGISPDLKGLASSAAQYTLIGSQATYEHWGLGRGAYCHASSPIRRYADLANQRLLKQLIRGNAKSLIVSVPMDDLNQRAKVSKGYERDRVFLNALLKDGKRVFEAIVLDLTEEEDSAKVCVWIPEWQQRAKMRAKIVEKTDRVWRVRTADESGSHELSEGQTIRVECGMNVGARRWKDRLVLRIL
jgi:exoribonuclease R